MFERIYRWLSRSLANQLLVTYLLVVTFALTCVTVWALVTIKAESIKDLRNGLEVEAVHLALEIDNDMQLDSEQATERIRRAVYRHASKLNLAITVVNSNGKVVADSGHKPLREGENISNQPEIQDALAGIAANYRRNLKKTEWLYVAYPVRSSGQTGGVIRVGVPLTDINQRVNRDLIVFLELTFATLIATALISIWVARRMTRPLREMSDMARQIAKSGDISVFVPVRRQDEISELGLSFNQMIGRLREEERLRQEFIANASHELKTPTMAIGSVVEALQAGAAEDPDLRKQFLHSLENLVDRQTSLLRDLLDITRLDAGITQDWQEEVKLSDILNDAMDQIRPQAQKKSTAIQDLVSAEGLMVSGKSIQLQRAFVNLLTNAVNYTPGGGTVTVATKVLEPDIVEVTIQDNGPGIDPSDLPHIFERFYRADKARTRTGGGTGLGLAITREIIARHHGVVEVDSAPGKGSTFTVRLPVKVQVSQRS
ncbi:MAG: ATP-binding protein [Candidatus Obscuribacterales bacterium]